MEARPRIRRGRGERAQRRHGRRVGALDEQPLRRVAPPAVWMGQRRDQIGGRRLRQLRGRTASRRLVHHTVDAPESGGLLEPARENLIAQILRDVVAVLNDAPIEIHDVERPVGRAGEIDGPEPLVGGRQELRLVVRPARLKRRAVVLHDDPAHEVARRLGDEDVAVELGGQPVSPVDHWRADGRVGGERPVGAEDTALIAAVHAARRPHRPDRVDLPVVALERLVAAARPKQTRIARVVGRRHEVHVQDRLVRVPIDPPRVVLRRPPLAARQRLLHVELVVSPAQVDIHLRGVHPVVERPEQAVRVVLDGRLPPAVLIGDQILRIRLQIPVGVFHQPEIRRLADQHAVGEHLERPRQDEPVGEHRAFVHLPVGVGVLEHDDPAGRLVLVRSLDVVHVAGHLDRPEAAIGVPVDEDRILNQRLAGHELDLVPVGHEEGLHFVGGRARRRVRGHALQPGWPCGRGRPRRRLRSAPRRDGRHCENQSDSKG